jgi:hydroxymethylbilane synthase
MHKESLIIATRESPLALWQANWVKKQLERVHPGLNVSLLGMTTQADRLPYISLAEIGGKGLFVKELEEALLSGRADIAVHSMKDVPVVFPPGLCLPVICQREVPWDAFVANAYQSIAELPAGAIVGTSSLRRQSQLKFLRPDLEVRGLRGNVNTRLARLDANEYAAIILAAAGLNRLGLQQRIRTLLGSEQFLPAPGQAALGIECREADKDIQALIAPLNDFTTAICVNAERALCKRLGGGCQVPIAAFAEIKNEKIWLRALVARVDGSLILQAEDENHFSKADALGIAVADDLLNQGAGEILKSLTS